MIISLWMVTVLSVLAIAIARYLSTEVRLTRYRLAREQAKVLARSGVYLALKRLENDGAAGGATPTAEDPAYDWLGDDWALPGDPIVLDEKRSLSVSIIDEERKLNVNKLPGPSEYFYKAIGALLTEELAARIVDYADPPEQPPVVFDEIGLETDESAQPPYFSKNAPVVALEELLDIPDMEMVDLEVWKQFQAHTTVYSNLDDKLNFNTVTPEVLIELGFGESTVEALRACQEEVTPISTNSNNLPSDANQCLGLKGGLSLSPEETSMVMSGIFDVTSQNFTVSVEGRVKVPDVQVRLEAVIRRKNCPEGSVSPCLIGWKERS